MLERAHDLLAHVRAAAAPGAGKLAEALVVDGDVRLLEPRHAAEGRAGVPRAHAHALGPALGVGEHHGHAAHGVGVVSLAGPAYEVGVVQVVVLGTEGEALA